MPRVVCSYQGAFSPPHLGHQGGAVLLAEAILKHYGGPPTGETHLVLFMPTNELASKDSLSRAKALASDAAAGSESAKSEFIGQEERAEMLQNYANFLNVEFEGRGVRFEVSRIEYNLVAAGRKATIYTLERLRETYPLPTVLTLGMGRDNGTQLPWWERVQEYHTFVDKVFVLDRKNFSLPAGNTFDTGLTFLGSGIPIEFENNGPWETTLNGTRKKWSASEIMNEEETGPGQAALHRGIMALCKKMVLLDAPLPVSSSEIRADLAADEDVSGKVGLTNAAFLVSHRIGKRTKEEVRAMLAAGRQLGGRCGCSRRNQKRRSKKTRRNKKRKTK